MGAIRKLRKNIGRPKAVDTGISFMGLPVLIGINHPNQAGAGEAFGRLFVATMSRARQYNMGDFIKHQQEVLENLGNLNEILN